MNIKKIALITIVCLIVITSGCVNLNPIERATKIIAEDIIPNLTNESMQWRDEWQRTRTKLPDEVRKQVDDAFNRAIIASEKAGFCTTEFFKEQLVEDLRRIIWNPTSPLEPGDPVICHTDPPSGMVSLDNNLKPEYKWIKFTGYNLDNPTVNVF